MANNTYLASLILEAYNKGVKDSAGKTEQISEAEAPNTYTGPFAEKYVKGYNYGVICNLDALKQNQTTYQPTDRQVVSSEENTTVSEPIKEENLNNPETILFEPIEYIDKEENKGGK